MDPETKVAVVIPCLNEGRVIHALVRGVRQSVPTVIVVDDGSRDGTPTEAARAGATVLRRSPSQGKGAALRAGFTEALRRGHDWALAMDGDAQHSPDDIPAFLGRLGGGAAMVIGNRMKNVGAMPFVRRVVNRWMSDRLGEFCGADLPDSQCGFRLVHLHAWRRLRFTAERFEIESEMIVRFLKANLPIEFIPIQTRYDAEQSKIRPLRDTVRWFRWWNHIRRELAASESSAPEFAPTPQDATA